MVVWMEKKSFSVANLGCIFFTAESIKRRVGMMGNTFRSFIDKLPEVIHVEEPEVVDTSIVDKFDEAIARANANATTGVMNEVIQAGEDSENEVSAMLANIINQKCDGDQVCTNMETMFGDGNGCAAGNPVCGTLGSIVWKEQCENKVNRGKPVHLELSLIHI